MTVNRSRAVEKPISPGQMYQCAHCEAAVKFRARHRMKAIICNVYAGDRWDRVEVFHGDGCYDEAGQPHGPVNTTYAETMPRTG